MSLEDYLALNSEQINVVKILDFKEEEEKMIEEQQEVAEEEEIMAKE